MIAIKGSRFRAFHARHFSFLIGDSRTLSTTNWISSRRGYPRAEQVGESTTGTSGISAKSRVAGRRCGSDCGAES